MYPQKITREILEETKEEALKLIHRYGFLTEPMKKVNIHILPFSIDRSAEVYWPYNCDDITKELMENLGIKCGDIIFYETGLRSLQIKYNVKENDVSVLDYMLHEYGHSLCALHYNLINSKEFKKAFWGGLDHEDGFYYDSDLFVTEYAATSPAEDFAECFWKYIINNGDLRKFQKPSIKKKMVYLRNLTYELDI